MAIATNKVSSLVTYISKYYLLQKSSSLLTNYPSLLYSLEPSSSLGHNLLSTFYSEDTKLCLAGRFYNFKHHKLDMANLSRKIVCYRLLDDSEPLTGKRHGLEKQEFFQYPSSHNFAKPILVRSKQYPLLLWYCQNWIPVAAGLVPCITCLYVTCLYLSCKGSWRSEAITNSCSSMTHKICSFPNKRGNPQARW